MYINVDYENYNIIFYFYITDHRFKFVFELNPRGRDQFFFLLYRLKNNLKLIT